MMTTDRDHLSIGEVLALLQQEYPDVTISKIRFLESQGLLDPERTPSGYRKFYESDVTRLRWILEQQRENFLPLKVIRERLESGEVDGDGPPPAPKAAPDDGAETPEARVAKRHRPLPSIFAQRADDDPLSVGPSEVAMTREELAVASGLNERDIEQLEAYGLVHPHDPASGGTYDGDCLLVARAAAQFKRHGVEARHLRTYKIAAEREAGLLEQALMPGLKQRDSQSRQDAAATLSELARLGGRLRGVALRAALRDHLPQR